MRVVLVCPTCTATVTLEGPPAPAACRECYQPFPDGAIAAAEQAMIGGDAPPAAGRLRPVLLTIGIGLAAITGGKALFATLAMAVMGGPAQVSGVEMPARMLALRFVAPAAAIHLAVAFGLWKERWWARPLILGAVAWSGATVLYMAAEQARAQAAIRSRFEPARSAVLEPAPWLNAVPSLAIVAVTGVALVLYLYASPGVRAYYAALERERREPQ